jgi:EAL domain-containing protein (putative c-di-GMP-specific phosphodiesterase class I)
VQWQAKGWLTGPMAVNLSSSQFEAPDFVDGVIEALADDRRAGHATRARTDRAHADPTCGTCG